MLSKHRSYFKTPLSEPANFFDRQVCVVIISLPLPKELLVLKAISIVLLFLLGASSLVAEELDYERDVRPILEEHCFKCHGAKQHKSDIRFDTLPTDLLKHRPAAETWHDARNAIHLGEMPPEDEPPLTSAKRKVLTTWIDRQLKIVHEAGHSTGGEAVLRRMNRVEYQNTMTDLLGVSGDYSANLPPDTPSEQGFNNNGAALTMSALQFEYYLASARMGLARAIVTGPEPDVITSVITESETKVKKTLSTNRLGAKGTFVARLNEFPDQGEFIVRVKARAELIDGVAYPRLKAVFGFRADTQTPSRELGSVDVTSQSVQEYEFRGRLEDFPIQSKVQSKYPGQLIWLTNTFNDGKPLVKKKRVKPPGEEGETNKKTKRKSRGLQEIEYENFPIIFIESVEFIGPVYDRWPPAHHTQLLPLSEERNGTDGELLYAKEVLTKFMSQAYRRPIEPSEVELILRFFTKVRPTVNSFEEAIRESFAMVLVSPEFLYLVEAGSGNRKTPLNDNEFASRLSYFLWSTMPDQRLFELAQSGELKGAETLSAEIDRMLSDARSWQFIEQFTDQWLDLGAVDRVAVNPEYYEDWDISIKPHMQEESRRFFAEILKNDLSALNLIDSDFIMLNARLATHYGIDAAPRGTSFERVLLPQDSLRGGLLTQSSILLGNSTGEDSHPILRAVWIRERLLNDPPAPPPPNVPALDADNKDLTKLSIRKQLEFHRKDVACNDCHRGIDPWGIALESFDAVGHFRDEIRRKVGKRFVTQPVEDATELPGGQGIQGVAGLKKFLLEKRKDQFARSLVVHLTSYALGRSIEFSDEAAIQELTATFAANDYKLRPLIHAIAQSELFQTK